MRNAFTLMLVITAGACSSPSGPVQRVHVPVGASFRQVTDSLAKRQIIKAPSAFRLYARISGGDVRVRPGTYGFRKGEAWSSILGDLRDGDILTAKLVIPEAFSIDRIAPRLAAISRQDSASIVAALLDTATVAKHAVPGPTLEGYLYPATYEVPVDVPLDTIIDRLVDRYKVTWTEERRAKAQQIGMTEREVITLASIVEKEAKRRDEMPTIASVYHNRLRIGMPLQADPTVQYALGGHRARLLYRDIDSVADNPYNTYRNRGLPPGPIGSPSEMGIDAVLNPADTKFLYFVARPDGSHVFTSTLAEHNRAKIASRRASTTTPSRP